MTCYSYTTESGTTRIHYFYDHAEVCDCGEKRLRRR